MKTYHIYTSYKSLPDIWDTLVTHDIFLQSSYFQALEEASPENIQCFYLGVYDNEELIGVGLIQHVQLYLKDLFRHHRERGLKGSIKKTLAGLIKGHVLVLGNLTHTGQHAFYFNKDAIQHAHFLELVFKALDEIAHLIHTQHQTNIHAFLLKDFFTDDPIFQAKQLLETKDWHQVFVQPNMIMPVLDQWQDMNDYLSCLNSKYKTRYKRARKKRNGVRCQELDLNAIHMCSPQLHELYLNVSKNASFNTFILPRDHFYKLKENLGGSFKVFGYYLNEELVGFFSLIINGKSLETYFLGYDEKHQHKHQLYLNMLYDMAKFGIENHFNAIVYARTAMEIKSSVGAVPRPMVMYLKHTHVIMNTLLKYVFGFMNPTQKWEERHPFLRS